MVKISVLILTKNSEIFIKRCLDALQKFDEVLIVDNGSTDNTLTIASLYNNVSIIKHDFIGFGPLKNIGISYCKNDWIFNIDSDEIVSEKLCEELFTLILDETIIYTILRKNHYNGRLIESCGWGNDWVMRLFNKRMTKFNDLYVHESLILHQNLKIKKLKGVIFHYPFNGANQLIDKMQNYSSLYAQNQKGIKKSSPLKAFSRAFFSFFKNYILQRGFLDGYAGLLISISNANGVFYKYIKLYEENLNNDV